MLWSHVSFWTLQYLIGALLSITTILYVYSKVKRTSLTTVFYLYGIAIGVWNLLIFFHRNASSRYLSHVFFRFSLPVFSLIGALIIILLGYIYEEKLEYWLILLIPISFSILFSIKSPFKIVYSKYGWSYFFLYPFGLLVYFSLFLIIIASIFIAFYLLKKVNTDVESRRIKLIVISVGGIYLGGMALTNLPLMYYSDFPPFGGILTVAEFFLITYAVTITPLEVRIDQKLEGQKDQQHEDLQSLYLDFLREFQRNIPDKRLGKNEIFLQESLKAMGLDDVLAWDEEGNLILDNDIIEKESSELVDTALRGMERLPVKRKVLKSYIPIINLNYKKMKTKDPEKAESWSRYILKRHGTFLNKMDLISELNFVEKRPQILKEMREKRVLVDPKKKPLNIYKKLDSLKKFGYDPRCLTKYRGYKIKNIVDLDSSDIIEVIDYIDNGKECSFSGEELFSEVENWCDSGENRVFIIDCIDVLMGILGEEDSIDVLDDLINKNKCKYIISYNKEILKENEKKLKDFESWSK